MRILLLTFLLCGCAADDLDYNIYAPQIVTGWLDENGKVHLKGVGGEDGYILLTGDE